MSDSTLYDDDILLWSEQQAEAIRRLGRIARDLPNDLDITNVAEEIESVGRSELAAVKSHIRLIFLHLMTLAAAADAAAAAHWRGEIVAFHAAMIERYTASMRQRIDADELWRSAREQLMLAYEGREQLSLVTALPASSVIALDDLLVKPLDSFALVKRLQDRSAPAS
ncbi:MAG TPA: DUF29 family protein [Xanthobacteraceae bacterium]